MATKRQVGGISFRKPRVSSTNGSVSTGREQRVRSSGSRSLVPAWSPLGQEIPVLEAGRWWYRALISSVSRTALSLISNRRGGTNDRRRSGRSHRRWTGRTGRHWPVKPKPRTIHIPQLKRVQLEQSLLREPNAAVSEGSRLVLLQPGVFRSGLFKDRAVVGVFP